MLISIIIPVFNGAKTLKAALNSVLSQERSLFELIVIDGGSTDGSVEILHEYCDQIDIWRSEPDQGVYDAMNKGVALARGNYLYFLGSDDVLLASLSEVVRYLRDYKSIYYGNVLMPSSGEIYAGPFTKWMMIHANICHQAMFYPSHVFRNEHFSLKYKALSDWEFNLRCISKHVEFRYMPLLIAQYADGGISSVPDVSFYNDRPRLIRRYFPLRLYLRYVLHRAGIHLKNRWAKRSRMINDTQTAR